jgi:hypothetical protein
MRERIIPATQIVQIAPPNYPKKRGRALKPKETRFARPPWTPEKLGHDEIKIAGDP